MKSSRRHFESVAKTKESVRVALAKADVKEWKDAQKEGKTPCRYCTDLANKKYMLGELSLREMVAKAKKRIESEHKKRVEKDAMEFEMVYSNAPKVDMIDIEVEWKKSSIWGYCPTANVTIKGDGFRRRGSGRAGGCGYDKLSACVATAFEGLSEFTRELADNYVKWSRGKDAKIPYGCSLYGLLPKLEGGVGYDCFDHIFRRMGYERVSFVDNGWNFSYYAYRRKKK